MKCSFCCCLKRDRATYNLSSTSVYYKNSDPITPTVTIEPVPLSSDITPELTESPYAKIIDSSDDKEISVINDDRASTRSMEDGGYAKITPIRSQQQSFDDDTELYATIDRAKQIKNRIKTDAVSATDATLRQISSPVSTIASPSQAIFSPGSHQPRVIIASQHPPPLAPVPFQVYTSTITNDHSNTSNRHPHYDQVTTRESLQYRAHRLQMEKEQSRQDQQLPGNDYLSTDREQERRTSGDVSRTVYPNRESPYHARPLNGSGIDDDDSSEYYATFIETNNNEQQSTTNGIYREDNSSKL